MSGKSFSHRTVISRSNGDSYASEIMCSSLSSKNQKKFVEEHFKLINEYLGLPAKSTISYETDDTIEAQKINNAINMIMNYASKLE